MSNDTTSSAMQVPTLREFYAALNRNDVPAAVAAFDPEIEWIEPPEYTGGGTYYGWPELRAHLVQARANWAEGSCDLARIVSAGNKVVVVISVNVRLKSELEWRTGSHAAVYTFQRGRAVQMRIFDEVAEALQWAGVDDSHAA